MMITTSDGRTVTKVAIVDDKPDVRESYGFTVENADLEPVDEIGPLGTFNEYIARPIFSRADAAICDYQLSLRAYAAFSGAELTAHWYRQQFPALLCTRWEKAQLGVIALYRRWIPALLVPTDLSPDTLVAGIEICVREFSGKFHGARQPWRTQVHFLFRDEDDRDSVYVEIPGWAVDEVVKLDVRHLPENLQSAQLEDARYHAYANLGAESVEELYLCDWEL